MGICELNNDGVRLLSNGQLDEARVVFAKAIAMSKVLVTNKRTNEANQPPVAQAHLQQTSFQSILIPDTLKNSSCFSNIKKVSTLSEGAAFVFRRAFLLPADQSLPIETVFLTVMFNMVSILKN